MTQAQLKLAFEITTSTQEFTFRRSFAYVNVFVLFSKDIWSPKKL
jgi:hypothetical protein